MGGVEEQWRGHRNLVRVAPVPPSSSSANPDPGAPPSVDLARPLRWLVITGAILVVAWLGLWLWSKQASRRPVPLPVLRQTGAFVVTNQAGTRLASDDFRGRPWAINLFFTRCPGPCARLSGLMRSVQDRLPADSRARLLSLTSDPAYDVPEALRSYAAKFGTDTNRWQFATGAPAEIRRLATEELLLVLQDKPEESRESADDLFLHSTLVVLMDGQGRLRTAFEGLEPGAADRVVAALRQLESED